MEQINTFAIIKTGGKQYKVAPGQKIQVEKLPEEKGSEIKFSDVLLVKDGDKIQTGKPTVSGAEVLAEVIRQFRDKKIIVFKKRSKKGYKKLQGHRQNLTEVLIKSVQAGA